MVERDWMHDWITDAEYNRRQRLEIVTRVAFAADLVNRSYVRPESYPFMSCAGQWLREAEDIAGDDYADIGGEG